MLSAEPAILFQFHSFRMRLLVFLCVVITLFAFRACQCNSRAHNFHLHTFIVFSYTRILGIKKRLTSKLFYHNTIRRSRQFFFVFRSRGDRSASAQRQRRFCIKSVTSETSAALFRSLFPSSCAPSSSGTSEAADSSSAPKQPSDNPDLKSCSATPSDSKTHWHCKP